MIILGATIKSCSKCFRNAMCGMTPTKFASEAVKMGILDANNAWVDAYFDSDANTQFRDDSCERNTIRRVMHLLFHKASTKVSGMLYLFLFNFVTTALCLTIFAFYLASRWYGQIPTIVKSHKTLYVSFAYASYNAGQNSWNTARFQHFSLLCLPLPCTLLSTVLSYCVVSGSKVFSLHIIFINYWHSCPQSRCSDCCQ